MTDDVDAPERTSRTNDDLATAIIARLQPTYDLVYVDRDDQLTTEQVGFLVEDDFEQLWESLNEFESQAKWDTVKETITELVDEVITDWERAEPEADFDDLKDNFTHSDEWDRVRWAIEDRGTGDWVKELARGAGRVLLRIPIDALDEDAGISFTTMVTAPDILGRIGFDASAHNLAEVDYVLREHEPEYHVAMGYWIVGADVEAFLDLGRGGENQKVKITNPFLYLGNPFAGSGMISEKALTGTVEVLRSDLRTDESAFGYSVNEVFGGLNASQFEAQIKAVPAVSLIKSHAVRLTSSEANPASDPTEENA